MSSAGTVIPIVAVTSMFFNHTFRIGFKRAEYLLNETTAVHLKKSRSHFGSNV